MKEDIRYLRNCIVYSIGNEEIGMAESSKEYKQIIDRVLDRLEQLEKENIRLKYQDIPYLEGTIKGYKARIEELEKENEQEHKVENRIIKILEENYIPKSVIRDKIEELESYKRKEWDTYNGHLSGKIAILKEILEEE